MVRQESAKLLSAVRFRPAPPDFRIKMVAGQLRCFGELRSLQHDKMRNAKEASGGAQTAIQEMNRSGGDDAFAFFDGIDFVESGNAKGFFGAAGPDDFDAVDFIGAAESEVETLIGTGSVAAAGENVGALANGAGRDKNFCADGVARTFGAAD